MSLYVDVPALLEGRFEAPSTSVGGRRDDGVRLMYAGAVNTLVGPPESGKTLIAAAMTADQLFSGGSALWVDLDHNGPLATIARLRAFGIPADVLSDESRFRLAIPEDRDEVIAVIQDAATWRPTIAVVDSLGELIPMFGASSNDADEYTDVNRRTLAALASLGTGVLAVDHEAKSDRSRTYGATGTAAKKRTIDGAYLRVTTLQAFVPGVGGRASLAIVKDRHGHLRAHSPRVGSEPVVADFVLTVRDDLCDWRFGCRPAQMAPTAPTFAEADDLARLLQLDPPPTTVKEAQSRLRISTRRAGEAMKAYRGYHSGSVAETLLDVSGNTPENVFPVAAPIRGNGETLGETETTHLEASNA